MFPGRYAEIFGLGERLGYILNFGHSFDAIEAESSKSITLAPPDLQHMGTGGKKGGGYCTRGEKPSIRRHHGGNVASMAWGSCRASAG